MILFQRLFLIWFILLSVLPCTDDIIASIENHPKNDEIELTFSSESHRHQEHNHNTSCNCHATCSPICSCAGVHITSPIQFVLSCSCKPTNITSTFPFSNYSLVHIYTVWNPPQLI